MAVSLTITVTNAQATRIAASLGHPTSFTDPTWINATGPEVQAWILGQVQRHTLDYEKALAAKLDAATRDIEVW